MPTSRRREPAGSASSSRARALITRPSLPIERISCGGAYNHDRIAWQSYILLHHLVYSSYICRVSGVIDGHVVIDAHVRIPLLNTLKPAWLEWANTFSRDHPWRDAYDGDTPDPAALDALLADEGVDHALLFCEYSPRATGIQAIEDVVPIARFNPTGSAWSPISTRICTSHCSTSCTVSSTSGPSHSNCIQFTVCSIPAARNSIRSSRSARSRDTGDRSFRCLQLSRRKDQLREPELLLDVIDYFPDLQFVFAHGGRGWWYDTAAFMAHTKRNVLDLAGLPPRNSPSTTTDSTSPRSPRR